MKSQILLLSSFLKEAILVFLRFFFCLILSFLFSHTLFSENFFPISLNSSIPLPFELGFNPNYANLIFKAKSNYESIFTFQTNSSKLLRELEIPTYSKTEVLFQPVSPFAYQMSNFTIEIAKQNLVYFSSFSNYMGIFHSHLSPEFISLQLGLQYKFSNLKWFSSVTAGIKIGIQQFYDFTLSDRERKAEQKWKTSFFTQGIFLNTKGLVIEGMVRLPIQNIYDHEVMLKPEYFGRLGLYWNLPDKIKP